jgi:glycerophosphoryl diester phosphodiesterase
MISLYVVNLKATGRPLVVAHRGASGYAPENTFASFDLALEQGAEMIELDLHPCKDGDLVVMHDETVDRTTGGTGRISGMRLVDIKGLDAAAKTSFGKPQTVPTFSEVLERYSKRIPLMVEVKHGSSVYPGIERKVVEELEKHEAADDVELISFDLDCLLRLKQESRGLKTGFIFIGNVASFADLLKEEVDALHGMWNFVTKEQVAHARKLGLPTFVWTVNAQRDIQEVQQLGADGLVSNFPDRALAAVRG